MHRQVDLNNELFSLFYFVRSVSNLVHSDPIVNILLLTNWIQWYPPSLDKVWHNRSDGLVSRVLLSFPLKFDVYLRLHHMYMWTGPRNPYIYNLNRMNRWSKANRISDYSFHTCTEVCVRDCPTNVYSDSSDHWYPRHWQRIRRKRIDSPIVGMELELDESKEFRSDRFYVQCIWKITSMKENISSTSRQNNRCRQRHLCWGPIKTQSMPWGLTQETNNRFWARWNRRKIWLESPEILLPSVKHVFCILHILPVWMFVLHHHLRQC